VEKLAIPQSSCRGQYVLDEHHAAPANMTDDDIGRLAMTSHGFQSFSHTIPNPRMMIGYFKISGHRTAGARTRFDPMAYDPDRWEATVHRLANQAYIMSTGSQIFG